MKSILSASLLIALITARASAADTPALDILSLGASGQNYTQGSYSLGWHFTATKDLNVTALGFYDSLKNGISGNHDVGIYDVSTKKLLVSTTVVPADKATGFFRYHKLPAPFVLPGGKDYIIQAVTLSDLYSYNTNTKVDPAIIYRGTAVYYGNDKATSLHYPDSDTPGTIGDFGPSFLISNSGAGIIQEGGGGPAVELKEDAGGKAVVDQPFCMGYIFTPAKDIKVASIGYYDDAKDGFKEPHNVTIFNVLDKSPVVSVIVASTDPLRGNFRYHPITPVTLSSALSYAIMGANSGDKYLRDTPAEGLTVNPLITLKGSAFTTSPPTLGAEYPTTSDTDPPLFGPTFEIAGNDPVSFVSAPTAAPSFPGVGQSAIFTAAAQGGTIAFTYTWNFGDGTTATGETVTHAYTAAGSYTVTVKVVDVANAQITGNVNVVVPVVGFGIDSDGDGFSDSFEAVAGSNPASAASTPTGTAITTAGVQPLTLTKAAIALNFLKPDSDSITFAGTIPIPAGFHPQDARVLILAGGIIKSLTLTAEGSAAQDGDSFKLKLKSQNGEVVEDPSVPFTAGFKSGTFADTLAATGLTNTDIKNAAVPFPITLIINNTIYQKIQPLHYTSKHGKSATAK